MTQGTLPTRLPNEGTSERSGLKPAGRSGVQPPTGPRLATTDTENQLHPSYPDIPTKEAHQITTHFLPQNKKADMKTAFHSMAVTLTLAGGAGNLCRHQEDALLVQSSEAPDGRPADSPD